MRFVLASVALFALFAQSPAPSPLPPAPTPTITIPKDDLVDSWIETLAARRDLANVQCSQTPGARLFQQTQIETLRKIEARMPCCTLDVATMKVILKPTK
jgi:hypothetical protein